MSACILGIGVILISSAATSSNTDHKSVITAVRKVIIDTDAGVDDAVAIMVAVAASEDHGLKILGITCVNGNAYVDDVVLNVLKTLKVLNKLDIPVYKGAAHPILVNDTKDHYFGKDGFGDFDYPDPPSRKLVKPKHAVNAMIDLVMDHPGEVTLLTLGPLTNVALAIRMCPTFLENLQQLIVMGGSTRGRGSSRPDIEYNFFADPTANYIVLNSTTSKPVILIPRETSSKSLMTTAFRISLSKSDSKKIWLINSAGALSWNTESKFWHCPDPVGTAVLITSGSIIAKSTAFYTEAIYDGIYTAGMVIVDYTNITRNAANVILVQGIDRNAYKRILTRYLN